VTVVLDLIKSYHRSMKFLFSLIFLNLFSVANASFCDVDYLLEDFPQSAIEQEDRFQEIMSEMTFCYDSIVFGKVAKTVTENTPDSKWYIKNLQLQYRQNTQTSFYQIGSDWNRKELDLVVKEKLDRNLFAIDDASGVFIGNKSEVGIIATNDHVVKGKKCESLNVTQSITGEKFRCEKIIRFGNKKFDMAFVLVNKVDASPLKIQFERQIRTKFLTAGRGFLHNDEQIFLEESSQLCQSLLVTDEGERTGCDVSNGDSGSPVFDKSNRNLYALVNATNTMIFSYTDDEYLKMAKNPKYKTLLNEQTSMITPFYLLKDNINNSRFISSEDRELLSCLYKSGCLK
jgi:hypothetical protein